MSGAVNRDLPRALSMAFGVAVGSALYNLALKPDAGFEWPRHLFMFAFTFAVFSIRWSWFKSARGRDKTPNP